MSPRLLWAMPMLGELVVVREGWGIYYFVVIVAATDCTHPLNNCLCCDFHFHIIEQVKNAG